MAPKLMTGPILPFVVSKNLFTPTVVSEDVPMKMEKVMSGPIYQGKANDPYNEFNEIAARKPHEAPMVGPIYPNIDTCNQFNPKQERVTGLLETAGPVYPVEVHNVYGPIPKREHEGEMMVGPVYHGIDTKNSFVPPKEKGHGEIANCGPVRRNVDHEIKFTPDILKAETEIARCGPVYYGIDAGKSNKYL